MIEPVFHTAELCSARDKEWRESETRGFRSRSIRGHGCPRIFSIANTVSEYYFTFGNAILLSGDINYDILIAERFLERDHHSFCLSIITVSAATW